MSARRSPATTATGTASLKLNRDPLGSQWTMVHEAHPIRWPSIAISSIQTSNVSSVT
jgi:hypothetical protein